MNWNRVNCEELNDMERTGMDWNGLDRNGQGVRLRAGDAGLMPDGGQDKTGQGVVFHPHFPVGVGMEP